MKYTVNEIASMLGVSRWAVSYYIKKGYLNPDVERIGFKKFRYVISDEELKRFLKDNDIEFEVDYNGRIVIKK